MTENTIGNAIERRDNGPEAIVRQHRDDLTLVLPTHHKGETWMRLATGALRRDANLRQVAARNPGSLMNALLECARLGHEQVEAGGLLGGVDDVALRFRDARGEWRGEWIPTQPDLMPRAVEMTVTRTGEAPVTLRFLVGPGPAEKLEGEMAGA